MKDQALIFKNGRLFALDQLLLPDKIKYIKCSSDGDVARIIKNMNVRGAPAIGIAAAYGFALAFKGRKFAGKAGLSNFAGGVYKKLTSTRPTAVNLFWACSRMLDRLYEIFKPGRELFNGLVAEAIKIHRQDVEANKKLGDYGAVLLPEKASVITLCNAGALATGGYGTALGVISSARRKGGIKMVYASETRPYLQGARLTAWELVNNNIPCRLITDNMAGYLMNTKKIHACIIGADRVARNGDTANKIGSYALAVLARYHNIPFYVACPSSTFDLTKPDGSHIPVEERSSDEVVKIMGHRIAPKACKAWHPAFDITPAGLISAIITEYGVIKPPFGKNIKKVIGIGS